MWYRTYWVERLERAWRERPIVWLSGVRRVGKTVLCQSLDEVAYFDCELPRVRQRIEDPESFLESVAGKRVVLDEVQRLADPSQVLKIAADHFPQTKVIATGSSTLGASRKFKDTLTGRKVDLWLTPMMSADLVDSGGGELGHRLLFGGLPEFHASQELPELGYQEWLDSYWARDIQELFRLEKRWGFQRLVELLLAQSGGMFEATRFAGPCELSRTTVGNYLEVLEATMIVQVVRPFSQRRETEIVSAPKVYGFDTGFVAHHRGWTQLRPEDLGQLWEHYVLNELDALGQRRAVRYWRDKRGHEIDFVLPRPGPSPTAIECKWSSRHFEPDNLCAFRRHYPDGDNWLVAADIQDPFVRSIDDLRLRCLGLADLPEALDTSRRRAGS